MTVKKAWLLLPPGKPNSRDPATRALAFFNLVAPVVKPLHVRLWSAYIAQRKACNQRVRDLLNSGWCDGEAPCPMLDQIRQGYVHVLKGIAALDNDTQQRLADCITPWECDVSTNGNCEVTRADIVTRIHSASSAAAIDVRMLYYHKPTSSGWTVWVSYRVCNPVPAALHRDVSIGSWKTALSHALVDHGRGRRRNPCEEKVFAMTRADARAVRDLLFGADSRIELVDVVRLMFASIGVVIDLARADSEDSAAEYAPRWDREAGSDAYKEFTREASWLLPHARWLGLNIRRACGVALPRDADFVDDGAELQYNDDSEEESVSGAGFLGLFVRAIQAIV